MDKYTIVDYFMNLLCSVDCPFREECNKLENYMSSSNKSVTLCDVLQNIF